MEGFQLFSSPSSGGKQAAQASSTKQRSKSKRKRTEPTNTHRETPVESEDAVVVSEDSSFEELGVKPWLIKQCAKVGIKHPTEVQRNSIPAVKKGLDCCIGAKTGSGKTASFAIPMLQELGKEPYGVFGIVLTPTRNLRELAFQIGEQFASLGKPIGLRHCIIVGGGDVVKQAQELSRRPHIIVATPGRLAAHISESGVANLKKLRFLVFDEADRLLVNTSFQDDLDTILEELPAGRQTLLFSATIPDPLPDTMASKLKNDYFQFQIQSKTATVTTLNQQFILMPSQVRHTYFINTVQQLEEESMAIVFTSTCRSCEELVLMLQEMGIRCVGLHSLMKQSDRLAALGKFKSSIVRILVATDVASRGLDIPEVDVVFNFNVPKSVEDYVHRVGRTARAGRAGESITFVSERDIELVKAIEEKTGVKMTEYEGLEEKEVLQSLNKVNIARRAANLKLLESEFGEKRKRQKKSRRERLQQEQQKSSKKHDTKKKH